MSLPATPVMLCFPCAKQPCGLGRCSINSCVLNPSLNSPGSVAAMSFLKFKQNRKLNKETIREPSGPLLPVETLNLEYSISAVAYNLSLNCKSCVADCDRRKEDEMCERHHNYSGLIGVVSKECFMIYHLDMKNNEAFASKHILNLSVPISVNHPGIRTYITEAKWVKLRKLKTILTVLVLTTNLGVCIYTEDGSKLVCNHETDLNPPEAAARGVIASTQHQVLVGNGKGEVLTFNFCEGTVEFRNVAAIQPEPITQLHCRQNILASGSPSGTVRIWKINNHNASKKCCFKTPSEECVTGLRIWEASYIIASYGSGVIRIFSWTYKRLLVRIFAHSRWIVSLDFLPHLGKLLTVAEDDAVLIWKLSCSKKGKREGLKGLGTIRSIKKKIKSMNRTWKARQAKPKISVSLDSAIHTENMLLIGGKFLNCSGTAVAIANYGVKELYFYGQSLSVCEEGNCVREEHK